MVQKSGESTTWDVAKTPVNNRDKLPVPQLVSSPDFFFHQHGYLLELHHFFSASNDEPLGG